jgi:hypothetical protein
VRTNDRGATTHSRHLTAVVLKVEVSRGTVHSTHKNVELTGGQIEKKKLVTRSIKTVSCIIHNPSLADYHLRDSEDCPGKQNLKHVPTDLSELNADDKVTYKL